MMRKMKLEKLVTMRWAPLLVNTYFGLLVVGTNCSSMSLADGNRQN